MIKKCGKQRMTYCGNDCCKECSRLSECGGCENCKGHPFGGSCIAERVKDFQKLKELLISEINDLGIEMPEINGLVLKIEESTYR